jgi:integrase
VNTLKTTRRRPTYIPRNANGERDEAKAAALAGAQPVLSPRGIEIIFGVLNRALKYAVDEQIIALNPAKTVVLPPVSIYEPRVLSDEEVERILQAIRGERLETLYHLWICLGLRRGEALKLKWKDLNLESGKASLFIRKGKTPASRRTIPLSNELVESLLQHREHQQREQEHFGVKWNPKRLVFPSLAGTSIIGRNVYRHYKALLVKAGVEEKQPANGAQVPAPDLDDDEPSVRIHDLRHWMCSYLLREGTPIKEVQEIMGHSTVSTTLKVYAHVIGDNKRQAVNRISQLLKKNG